MKTQLLTGIVFPYAGESNEGRDPNSQISMLWLFDLNPAPMSHEGIYHWPIDTGVQVLTFLRDSLGIPDLGFEE